MSDPFFQLSARQPTACPLQMFITAQPFALPSLPPPACSPAAGLPSCPRTAFAAATYAGISRDEHRWTQGSIPVPSVPPVPPRSFGTYCRKLLVFRKSFPTLRDGEPRKKHGMMPHSSSKTILKLHNAALGASQEYRCATNPVTHWLRVDARAAPALTWDKHLQQHQTF